MSTKTLLHFLLRTYCVLILITEPVVIILLDYHPIEKYFEEILFSGFMILVAHIIIFSVVVFTSTVILKEFGRKWFSAYNWLQVLISISLIVWILSATEKHREAGEIWSYKLLYTYTVVYSISSMLTAIRLIMLARHPKQIQKLMTPDTGSGWC